MSCTPSPPPTWPATSARAPPSRSPTTPPASWPRHRAAIYIGSTYDEPLPAPFLDDVASGEQPGDLDVRQHLAAHRPRSPDFAASYGFSPGATTPRPSPSVAVQGPHAHPLRRQRRRHHGAQPVRPHPGHGAGLGGARRRHQLPWAVRASNLTYVGEIPFATSPPTTATWPSPTCCSTPWRRPRPNATGRWCASRTSARTPTPNAAGHRRLPVRPEHPVQRRGHPPLGGPQRRLQRSASPSAFGFGDSPDMLAALQGHDRPRAARCSCTATPTS